jgi:NNP family nitrate/nitrite transporter-like MFS transporter
VSDKFGRKLSLTILSFVSFSEFFMVIGIAAIIVLVFIQFIDEPKGHMVEVQEDGTVEMIELN